MTKIAIILLNWKGTDDTIECIRSIATQTNVPAFQTIIVDNASGDGSPERITAFCSDAGISFSQVGYDSARGAFASPPLSRLPDAVTLVEADKNLGFCIGNNIGADYAFRCGADAVLILNNDTTVAPDMVEKLVAAADVLGPRTLISPQILYADAPETIWWFGGDFSRTLSPSYCHQGELKRQGGGIFPQTDWVSGCATLISREVYDEIGLYDPLFFIWCEEWDLSLRARTKGFSLHIAQDAVVYHKVGRSLGLVSPLTFFYAMRNMIFLRRRYLGQPLRMAFWIVYLPRKLMQAVRLSLRNRDLIYFRAFLDALSDRKGGIWKRQ